MNVAIVGSRNFADPQQVTNYVNGLDADHDVVISGGARGVDTWAYIAAKKRDMRVIVLNADWDLHGKKAGYLRNADIVIAADRVVAFWDGQSKGTLHSINLAKKAGKPVEVFSASR